MLRIGIKGNLEKIVTEQDTARVIGSGELDVLATPSMIATIEETAWRSVASELETGQGTVGTKLEVDHLSATPVGMKFRCETELTEIDRRRLVFQVYAYDEAGLIASGTHERFVVDNEKFQTKANTKLQKEA